MSESCIDPNRLGKRQCSYLPDCKICPEMVPVFGAGTLAKTDG